MSDSSLIKFGWVEICSKRRSLQKAKKICRFWLKKNVYKSGILQAIINNLRKKEVNGKSESSIYELNMDKEIIHY